MPWAHQLLMPCYSSCHPRVLWKTYLSTFECLKQTKSLSFVSPAPPAVGASLLARNKECNERLAALMPVHLPEFFSGNSQSLHDAIKMPAGGSDDLTRDEDIVSSRDIFFFRAVLRPRCVQIKHHSNMCNQNFCASQRARSAIFMISDFLFPIRSDRKEGLDLQYSLVLEFSVGSFLSRKCSPRVHWRWIRCLQNMHSPIHTLGIHAWSKPALISSPISAGWKS
jgi:hypothetical protein